MMAGTASCLPMFFISSFGNRTWILAVSSAASGPDLEKKVWVLVVSFVSFLGQLSYFSSHYMLLLLLFNFFACLVTLDWMLNTVNFIVLGAE